MEQQPSVGLFFIWWCNVLFPPSVVTSLISARVMCVFDVRPHMESSIVGWPIKSCQSRLAVTACVSAATRGHYPAFEARCGTGLDPQPKILSNSSETARKLLWNCSETALKLLWSKTALKLLWNCSETAIKLLWNCNKNWSETALKLLWNCSETALILNCSKTALIWNCSEIAIKVLKNCSETAIKLLWNCNKNT